MVEGGCFADIFPFNSCAEVFRAVNQRRERDGYKNLEELETECGRS